MISVPPEMARLEKKCHIIKGVELQAFHCTADSGGENGCIACGWAKKMQLV